MVRGPISEAKLIFPQISLKPLDKAYTKGQKKVIWINLPIHELRTILENHVENKLGNFSYFDVFGWISS